MNWKLRGQFYALSEASSLNSTVHISKFLLNTSKLLQIFYIQAIQSSRQAKKIYQYRREPTGHIAHLTGFISQYQTLIPLLWS